MKDIWIISDTHFFHQNIIKYGDRPFKTVTEMNEFLVEQWNSTVKDGDKVYHLGDVYMGNGLFDDVQKLLSSLRGQKRLILGNHDNGKDQILQKTFKKIDVWRMFPEFGLLLTHVPIHEQGLSSKRNGKTLINVHGHIHQNKSPDGPYKCVCVEQTNYKPIHIEDLIRET